MHYVIGVDEAGRGAWAGPFVAAACVLNEDINGLADSKKLSLQSRKSLHDVIIKSAQAAHIVFLEASEVDKHGLTWAQSTAMSKAVTKVLETLELETNDTYEIIIDGSVNYISNLPYSRSVVRADGLFPSVMAASILAKYERDTYMRQLSLVYPQYGFDTHVGYGTQFHADMLVKYGITAEHRQSFKPIRQHVL